MSIATLIDVVDASLGTTGVGHVYLREWQHATAWLTFIVGVGLVLLSTFTDPAIVAVNSFPREMLFLIPELLSLGALDTYHAGSHPRGRNAGGESACPVCGRELDRNPDSCPWCATELEWYTVGR